MGAIKDAKEMMDGKVVRLGGREGREVRVTYAHLNEGGGRKQALEDVRATASHSHSHSPLDGLTVTEKFVDEDLESEVYAFYEGENDWACQDRKRGGKLNRRVIHYGYVFDYTTNDVLREREGLGQCPGLPQTGPVGKVVHMVLSMYPSMNQITVNEYDPGQGIGKHVDNVKAFGDNIVSVSFGGGVVMEFRELGEDGEETGRKENVYLGGGSLVSMTSSSRYKWTHSISSRKTDLVEGSIVARRKRISLTFRTALSSSGSALPCVKMNPLDDSMSMSKGSSTLGTPEVEKSCVEGFYDLVAKQWQHTRSKRGVLWSRAVNFILSLPRNSTVLDVGCGDGKYFPVFAESGCYVVGLDVSEELLKLAMEQKGGEGPDLMQKRFYKTAYSSHANCMVGSCLHLPFSDGSFDYCICVAVMHHLSSFQRRVECLREIRRVLRVDGTVDVQVWAMEQSEGSKREFDEQDVFVPFKVGAANC